MGRVKSRQFDAIDVAFLQHKRSLMAPALLGDTKKTGALRRPFEHDAFDVLFLDRFS
jgi:hypothetical protein